MASDLKRFQEIRTKVESLQREIDRSQGALENALESLQKEFGCEDLDSAKKLLERLIRREVRAKKQFESALDDFEQKWGKILDEQ